MPSAPSRDRRKKSIPGPACFEGDPLAAAKQVPGVVEVVALLGSGSFTYIYHCTVDDVGRDGVQTRRAAAVKLVASSLLEEARESRLLLDLEHPHLVRLYRVHEGPPYAFSFEFCAGGSIERVIHSSEFGAAWRRLLLKKRARIALDIGAALEFLHGHGIVHREVTSKNCFLMELVQPEAMDGSDFVLPRAKLGYIGVARPAAAYFTTRGIGLVRSMPPEIISCNRYESPADVFALGIMLHELVSGSVPYSNLSCNAGALAVAICSGHRPAMDSLPLDGVAGAELRSLLLNSWSADAAHRPTAAEFIARLRRLIAWEVPDAPPAPPEQGAAAAASGPDADAVRAPRASPAQGAAAPAAGASAEASQGSARAAAAQPAPFPEPTAPPPSLVPRDEQASSSASLPGWSFLAREAAASPDVGGRPFAIDRPPRAEALRRELLRPNGSNSAEDAPFRPALGPGSLIHGDDNWVRIL